METSSSVTPGFDGLFDSMTDDVLKQPNDIPTSSEYPDPEIAKHPFATSPYPPGKAPIAIMTNSPYKSPGQAPIAIMTKPYPQNALASGPQPEPSRWIPCAPPPGIPVHPPPPQREPSRWVPCAPPIGYPKQILRQQREPSRWTPCAPPPGQPAHITRSAPSPLRGPSSSPSVARMPFHHPEISERLGLQKYCPAPVSYPSSVPRSAPAYGFVSQARSTKPVFGTIDPAVSVSVKSSPPSPPCGTLPNMNRGFPQGQPVSPIRSPTISVPMPEPSSAKPSQFRRGSIHVEDLYSSDEDSEGNDSDLSPAPSSAIKSTSTAIPRKRKCSAPKPCRGSQPDIKKRKLLAEIRDTDEFVQSQGQEIDSDDDDDDDIDVTPMRQRRKLKGQGDLARRSVRQKKRVASYAEE